jgi:hypothetical protein
MGTIIKNQSVFISFLIAVSILLFVGKSFSQIKDTSETENEKFLKDTINGVYIPKDMEDCFNQIDSFWSDSLKDEIRKMSYEDFVAGSHFGVGMWMRNNWGLWGGSRLSKYFNERGYWHPDDMSGEILSLYYKRLKGEVIDMDKWKVKN